MTKKKSIRRLCLSLLSLVLMTGDICDFQSRNSVTSEMDMYNGYAMNEDGLPRLSDGHLHSGSSEDDVDSGFSNKSNDHFDHK